MARLTQAMRDAFKSDDNKTEGLDENQITCPDHPANELEFAGWFIDSSGLHAFGTCPIDGHNWLINPKGELVK